MSLSSTLARYEQIVAPVTSENPRQTEGSLVELNDGRLLLAWSDFYGAASDWAAACISARHSSDGGRTWLDKFTLVENVGDMNTYSPNLVRLQSGVLGLAYFVKQSEADCRAYWAVSHDEGDTWSERTLITPEPAYYIINNERTIQHSSGRLIVPVSFTPTYFTGATFAVYCCYSDDEGQSWQRSPQTIQLPRRGAMEPGLVECQDGSLLMLMRTQLGCQYHARSVDGGITWSDAAPLHPLISPESPATIKRIPKTGDLLAIWNYVFDPFYHHFGRRTPLTTAISRDNGHTWTNLRHVERDPNRSYSYPTILFRGDEVLLTYWQSRTAESDFELKLTILPLEWFYGPEESSYIQPVKQGNS